MACRKLGQGESKRNWLPQCFRNVEERLIFNEYFQIIEGKSRKDPIISRSQTLRAGTLEKGRYPATSSALGANLGPAGRWAGVGGWWVPVWPWCRLFCSRDNIARAQRAHPVRGKDRSPPDRNHSFSRTNFLPINADLGRTKGSSSCQ